MAGQDSDQEKTEEATQTRRDEYRKKGQVAQTKELASTLFLLAIAGLIFALSRFFFAELWEIFNYSLGAEMVALVRGGDVVPALSLAFEKIFILSLPVLAVSLLVGVASTILQVGFLQVEEALTPKFEKVDPINGLKRMFSMKSLMEGVKSILKLIFVAAILAMMVQSEVVRFPLLIQYSVGQIIEYMGEMTVKLFAGLGLAMLVLAIGDFFFQRWDLEKQMRMTKQEVKEEHKQREGDPLIKARIRRVQREMANKRMMEKVPQADVIITNPTHIAVALKYDDTLPAPQLIAKGADQIAEKIKAIAKENNIPVIENKPLARTIFKTMKLGQVIPRELFVAVAEVLSYVYKLKKRMRR